MSKVNEMFGLYTGGAFFPDLQKALTTQMCPYSGSPCYKTRKSDPDTAIGTCSLNFGNVDQPILRKLFKTPLQFRLARTSSCHTGQIAVTILLKGTFEELP